MPNQRRFAVLAVLAALAAITLITRPATAQESSTPRLSFNAFGTAGLTYSSEDQADFAWNPFQSDGPGHTDPVSHGLDSRLGGQATLEVTSKLTTIVQVVLERNNEGDYAPQLEWANLGYALTPALTVRAGRLVIPAFLTSDYRKVGFANPWVRPPVELYGLVPVFTSDGVDAHYRMHTGDWTTVLGAQFGRSHANLPDGSDVELENVWNVNATVQRGSFTGRVAVANGEMYVESFEPLFDGFRAFGPEGEEIADRFAVDGSRMQFASAGAGYDPGRWFAMAEIAWSDLNSVLGEGLAGQATGGYRLGSFTPYAAYSRSGRLSDSSDPGLSLASVPPEQIEAAATLNAILNGILRSAPVQQTLAVGGRWDFRPGMSLKLQVDFIDALGDSPGTFINQQPGFEPGGSARLVSLALDFVL
jgi:hypothetical protein